MRRAVKENTITPTTQREQDLQKLGKFYDDYYNKPYNQEDCGYADEVCEVINEIITNSGVFPDSLYVEDLDDSYDDTKYIEAMLSLPLVEGSGREYSIIVESNVSYSLEAVHISYDTLVELYDTSWAIMKKFGFDAGRFAFVK